MKKFLIFSCLQFYPYGGFLDFVHDTDSYQEAAMICDLLNAEDHNDSHIVDSQTGFIVYPEEVSKEFKKRRKDAAETLYKAFKSATSRMKDFDSWWENFKPRIDAEVLKQKYELEEGE